MIAGAKPMSTGRLRTLLADAAGATAIEYALVAALIALTIVGAVGLTGDNLLALPLSDIANAIAGALT